MMLEILSTYFNPIESLNVIFKDSIQIRQNLYFSTKNILYNFIIIRNFFLFLQKYIQFLI